MKTMHVAVFIAAWSLLGGAGLAGLLRYEKSPGDATAPPAAWPASSSIQPSNLDLIMFAHPHCPCTRASIGELARLLARHPAKAKVYVFFVHPAEEAPDWSATDLWRSAAMIPGVIVGADIAGAEARRFHVTTSGSTLLYGSRRLLFAGGITGGRGHAGDNPGCDALGVLFDNPAGSTASTAVFGCPLTGGTSTLRILP